MRQITAAAFAPYGPVTRQGRAPARSAMQPIRDSPARSGPWAVALALEGARRAGRQYDDARLYVLAFAGDAHRTGGACQLPSGNLPASLP